MNEFEEKRRSFLSGLSGIGITQLLVQSIAPAQGTAPAQGVLAANEGEHLIHFRDHGIFLAAMFPLLF